MHVTFVDIEAKMVHGKNVLFNRYLVHDEINHQDSFVFICEGLEFVSVARSLLTVGQFS